MLGSYLISAFIADRLTTESNLPFAFDIGQISEAIRKSICRFQFHVYVGVSFRANFNATSVEDSFRCIWNIKLYSIDIIDQSNILKEKSTLFITHQSIIK